MKISVLIAAQRAGQNIARALASVGAQSHTQWEVLVIEYGSNDETEAAVRQFAANHGEVRFERIAESPGIAAVRNRLLQLAEADAAAFLDPDDSWLPRHLSHAEQQLGNGADIVVSNLRTHNAKVDALAGEIIMPAQLSTNPTRTIFMRDVIPVISCVVFRRSVAVDAGAFDTRFASGEARDLWLRCALNHARFAVTHRPTCHCTPNPRNDVTRALQVAEHTTQFYEKYHDLAAVPAALRRRLLVGSLVAQGRLLRTVDPNRAARCFWRAWSLQPVHVQTLGQFALTGWPFPPPGGHDDSP
jgi:glycosyltransferase involved in cell wall biosynthesis